jgi:hypothetical protein
MIVVVEGISASGKSTWCAEHGAGHIVAENGHLLDVPDRISDPRGVARFWAERNADRWQAALFLETATSLAVCDTDPLKLHYTWCMWRIGEASKRDWMLDLAVNREMVANGRIGFADVDLVGVVEVDVAQKRARADSTRRRRNFELHVRLQPPLVNWYSALDMALPGRVRFGIPKRMPGQVTSMDRHDLCAFDRTIDLLPRR